MFEKTAVGISDHPEPRPPLQRPRVGLLLPLGHRVEGILDCLGFSRVDQNRDRELLAQRQAYEATELTLVCH
jgi:hypothetical protein